MPPMMPGAPPAPPPPMGGGTGAAASHGPMAGSAMQGIQKVKLGVEALQAALPTLPMGGELHQAVMKAITDISKHMTSGQGGDAGGAIQQLIELMRNAKQQPGAAGAMPGAAPGGMPPPAMPPMSASPPSGG